ncbi:MAG: choice-of-anchor L domain-containing protein [Planctomycetota bacterium]
MRPLSTSIVLTLCFALMIGCGGGGGSHNAAPVSQAGTTNNAPTLAFESPTAGTAYLSKENKVSLSGSATDDSAISKVQWSTDAGTSGDAAGTDTWSILDIPLLEGDNRITIIATDDQGLTAQQTLIVTYNAFLFFHGEPQVNPSAVFTQTSTDLIAHVAILPNANLIDTSVKLLKVDAEGKTIQTLGEMYDDGNLSHGDDIKGDSVFSAKITVLEAAAGNVYLRAAATTQETGGKVDAFTQIISLPVVDPVADTIVADAVVLQEQALDKYTADAAATSEAEALTSTANWLKGQAGVKTVEITSSGDIWVEFDSGFSGIILCGGDQEEGGTGVMQPLDRHLLAPTIPVNCQTTGVLPMSGANPPPSTDPDVVLNTKAILYAPFHSQFSGWGTEFCDSLHTRLGNAAKPKFKSSYVKDSSADVDVLDNLTAYGLIVFHTHGGVDDKGNVILSTGEVFSATNYVKHALRFLTRQLTLVTIHGHTYWGILPDFIKHLAGSFPNSIIYAGACSSSRTGTLSGAFLGKKAATYFGFSNTVLGSFDRQMADQLFPKLIDENKTTGESFVAGQHDSHAVPAYFTMAGNAKAHFKVGLINGDFEMGNLTGWSTSGDGRVVSKLGYVIPWENSFMGIISTGLGYTTSSGAISQAFWVDPDNTTLTVKWNFLSEEFMEWVGSQFQDFFQIKIIDEQGASTTIFHQSIDDIANSYSLSLVSPDIVFDKGDVYMTDWQFLVYSLLPWADQYVTIELSCGDVGDSIYDTAILLDAIVAGS